MRLPHCCYHLLGLFFYSWSLIVCPSSARADGGTVRLSEQKGGYRITVFASPTPLRAGTVDISVLVQDAASAEAMPGVRVTVRTAPRGRLDEAVIYPAMTEAATNKLFHAAVFDLPRAGWWQLEIVVEGKGGTARVPLEVEAAEALPRWMKMWPWIGWPVVVILLFGVHQFLVRQACRLRLSMDLLSRKRQLITTTAPSRKYLPTLDSAAQSRPPPPRA